MGKFNNMQSLARLYHKGVFGSNLIKNRLSRNRVPLMANLLLTYRCNLKCFYCYVDTANRYDKEIEIGKFYKLIDILYNRGTRLIVLLGGEPLLYNGIGDLIRYIKNKKIICEVITNGYLIKKHIGDLLLCDSVCISLDGNEEEHDMNRGKGSYRIAVEAVELLKTKNIPVRIKAVLTRNNNNSLKFLSQFAKDKKLIFTVSTAAEYDNRDYEQKDKWLDLRKKKQFYNDLFFLKKQGIPVGYSFKALRYILKWPYEDNFIIKKDCSNHTSDLKLLRCKRKDNSLYIDADGSMYPCAYQWGKDGKNVFTDGFDAAWQNMAGYDCYACGSLPDIDLSYLFNCNIENIINAVKIFRKR